jgi:hypothetical protein
LYTNDPTSVKAQRTLDKVIEETREELEPDTPPMFYIRQKLDNRTFAITSPSDLSSKPGGVVVTTEFHMPNYLSIKDDRWVSSNGTILTCEELFEELTNAKDTELVYLSDYDFQVM